MFQVTVGLAQARRRRNRNRKCYLQLAWLVQVNNLHTLISCKFLKYIWCSVNCLCHVVNHWSLLHSAKFFDKTEERVWRFLSYDTLLWRVKIYVCICVFSLLIQPSSVLVPVYAQFFQLSISYTQFFFACIYFKTIRKFLQLPLERMENSLKKCCSLKLCRWDFLVIFIFPTAILLW